jgi:hypothetical protein
MGEVSFSQVCSFVPKKMYRQYKVGFRFKAKSLCYAQRLILVLKNVKISIKIELFFLLYYRKSNEKTK